MILRIVRLGDHDRSGFSSGSDELDRYFRTQAGQDVRRRLAQCFVTEDETGAIVGFYTLSATSLLLDQLSEARARRLPRYPTVPAVLLGRLAVSQNRHGEGIGGLLVADALIRAAGSDVLGHAMIVDAKDEAATAFYEHMGFEQLVDDRRRLIRLL